MSFQGYGIISNRNPWPSTAYTRIFEGLGLSSTSVPHGCYSWSNPSGDDGVTPAPPHAKTIHGPEKGLWKKIPGAQITYIDPPSWQTTLFCS